MDPASVAVDVGLLALIGGLLSLDRRSAFQMMASQPLVTVGLLGFVMGDAATGVQLGALLQLLWMSSFLFGASVPPHETLGSVVVGGLVLLYGRHVAPPDLTIWSLALLLGAPMAVAGRWLDVRLDRGNSKLAERADEAARAGSAPGLGLVPGLALLRALLAYAVFLGPPLVGGLILLASLRGRIGGVLEHALLILALYGLPALGLAVSLSTVRRRRGLVLAAASFLVVFVALQSQVVS